MGPVSRDYFEPLTMRLCASIQSGARYARGDLLKGQRRPICEGSIWYQIRGADPDLGTRIRDQ